MLVTSFERLENEEVCCGCGRLINAEEPTFKISQEQQTVSNIEIILCEDCGNSLQNDMSDDYCRFVDLGQ